MRLVFCVDVEEEGLFSGRYETRPGPVESLVALRRLEPVTEGLGIPLSLLVDYAAAADERAPELLGAWRRLHGAEIGAHLHPWSTPPFSGPADDVAASHVPGPLMAAKLDALIGVIEERLGVRPTSFRMGRWDFTPDIRQLLGERGFRVDSSIVPLHRMPGRPDYFLAPRDPHWITAGPARILEVPLTQAPVIPGTERFIHSLARRLPRAAAAAVNGFWNRVGVIGVQPVWFPLGAMKRAARRHASSGGRVLVISLHSSELMPGQHPSLATDRDVDRLTEKIRRFLEWAISALGARGATLEMLHARALEEERGGRTS